MKNFEIVLRSLVLMQQSISRYSFWVTQKRYFPLLSKISMKIFSLITSTASVERSFKFRGNINTKIRNRIDPDTCSKLLTVKMNNTLLKTQSRGIKRRLDTTDICSEQKEDGIDLTGEEEESEVEELIDNLWEEE